MKQNFPPKASKVPTAEELLSQVENWDDFSVKAQIAPVEKFKEIITRQLKSVPAKYIRLFWKTTQGKVSARQAIKAKCQNCVGYSNTQDEIQNCTTYNCPLWSYRPYQPKTLNPTLPTPPAL